jgi:hypothetical protein
MTSNSNSNILFQANMDPNTIYLAVPVYITDNKLKQKIFRIMRYNLGHKLNFYTPDLRAHVDGILRENLFRKFHKAVPNFTYLEERSWFCKNSRLQHKLLDVVNKGLGQQVNVAAGDLALHLDCVLYSDKADKYPLYEKYINDAWYIGRFHLEQNPTLDKLFYDAVNAGRGSEIDVRAADIRAHLDCLIHENDHFYVFRKYVHGFEYLETRSWFMRSTKLQDKLFEVVQLGYGPIVHTAASDFREHLDDILSW